MTKIEWTDETWNPVTGCTKASPGCDHCYAERMSHRLAGRYGYPRDEPFRVTLHPDRLGEPLRWRKPRRVFVCSMGDLFHPDVSDVVVAAVWGVMSMATQHTFQVLTKRPERALEMATQADWPARMIEALGIVEHGAAQIVSWLGSGRKPRPGLLPLPNVWLGTTCEDQARADERIPLLLQIPAVVRFASVEPMLGPVELSCLCAGRGIEFDALAGGASILRDHYLPRENVAIDGLDWVICGAETGPGARPMDLDWARSLRDQCKSARVPFFFKKDSAGNRELDGWQLEQWPEVPR